MINGEDMMPVPVPPPSRARTVEEVRAIFGHNVEASCEYWLKMGGSKRDAIHGAVFSVLAMLDGDTGGFPMCNITLVPHPGDKEYCISMGENYYEAGMELGDLHDINLNHKAYDVAVERLVDHGCLMNSIDGWYITKLTVGVNVSLTPGDEPSVEIVAEIVVAYKGTIRRIAARMVYSEHSGLCLIEVLKSASEKMQWYAPVLSIVNHDTAVAVFKDMMKELSK